MFDKIRELITKHWDVLSYLFFGVLTTVVNFIVYFPLFNFLRLPATICNVIAWAVSVTFAFLTNKPFVFQSHDWSLPVVIPELVKFLGTRIGSGLLETGAMFITADLLGMNGNIMKILLSILVVIINYVGSKLLVFKK